MSEEILSFMSELKIEFHEYAKRVERPTFGEIIIDFIPDKLEILLTFDINNMENAFRFALHLLSLYNTYEDAILYFDSIQIDNLDNIFQIIKDTKMDKENHSQYHITIELPNAISYNGFENLTWTTPEDTHTYM